VSTAPVTHDISVDGRPAPVRIHSSFGEDPKFYSHAAVAYGEVRDDCLVRIHSRCMYSEVFDSRECDCGWQLKRSRELLTVQGGVLIYLDQEGRGAGLQAKANAYLLNNQEGLDTYQAYDRLGLPHDLREYADAVQILSELGLTSVRLLTNNPSKVEALEKVGITVVRVPLKARPTPTTVAYLKAKKRHGHLLLPVSSLTLPASSLTSPKSCRTIVAIGDFSLTAVRGQSGDTA
jgi:GTP cyclohydrolase II